MYIKILSSDLEEILLINNNLKRMKEELINKNLKIKKVNKKKIKIMRSVLYISDSSDDEY